MKYKRSGILVLVSLLALVGCNYWQGVVAQAPQKETRAGGTGEVEKQGESVQTERQNATWYRQSPLSYQIEIYNSQVMGGSRTYGVSLRQFPGSHTWQYWRQHLADSLTFVGEQFQLATLAHSADNLGFVKGNQAPGLK